MKLSLSTGMLELRLLKLGDVRAVFLRHLPISEANIEGDIV